MSSSPPCSPPTKPDKHIKKDSQRSPSSSSTSSIDFTDLCKGNHEDAMKQYFDWHVGRTPEDTEDLFAAYEALKIEQFQLQQLSSITMGTWKEMGIPLGIGFRLSNDLKKFTRSASACKGIFHVVQASKTS